MVSALAWLLTALLFYALFRTALELLVIVLRVIGNTLGVLAVAVEALLTATPGRD